jgi:hypothetical protein
VKTVKDEEGMEKVKPARTTLALFPSIFPD